MSFQNAVYARLGNNTKHLSELTQSQVRPLLQLAVKFLEHDNIPEGALEILCEKFNVNQMLVDEWFSTILNIVSLHLRYSQQSISQTEMKAVLQDLKFNPDCVQDIVTVLYGPKRTRIISNGSNRLKYHPEIVSINWKTNITISSSDLRRILKPHIVMYWTLSNGEKRVFYLTIQKFHQLRNLIAKLLLDIISTENINQLKNLQQD